MTSAAVALQGDEAMDESCVQQGVCVLCDYEKMVHRLFCRAIHNKLDASARVRDNALCRGLSVQR